MRSKSEFVFSLMNVGWWHHDTFSCDVLRD